MKMLIDEHNIDLDAIDISESILGSRKKRISLKPLRLQPVNLQLFADSGDKTEKATPKKREKAREEGQVLQSREMTAAIVLLCLFITVKIAGGYMYEQIYAYFKIVFADYSKLTDLFTVEGLIKLFIDLLLRF